MQSGPLLHLNFLQLEGCASKDVQWSPMLLFASSLVSHKFVHHWLSTSRSLALFCLLSLFHMYIGFTFLLSLHCFFAGDWLLLKPNSSSNMLWNEFARVWMEIPVCLCPILMRKVWPAQLPLAKYEHASRAHEHVNQIRPTSFEHATCVWACGNIHPSIRILSLSLCSSWEYNLLSLCQSPHPPPPQTRIFQHNRYPSLAFDFLTHCDLSYQAWSIGRCMSQHHVRFCDQSWPISIRTVHGQLLAAKSWQECACLCCTTLFCFFLGDSPGQPGCWWQWRQGPGRISYTVPSCTLCDVVWGHNKT